MMKCCVLVACVIMLSGCTSRSIARHVVDGFFNIETGSSESACNQLRMKCSSQPGQVLGANGHFSKWENADGSVGCSCDKR